MSGYYPHYYPSPPYSASGYDAGYALPPYAAWSPPQSVYMQDYCYPHHHYDPCYERYYAYPHHGWFGHHGHHYDHHHHGHC
ncbi:hypothetical protein AAVH_25213 [Aphelenchoides avenae]|nr:hypothetical protein AAVH_25213 [Aphelenchus avenae]